jgi:hypothetical protein
MNDNQTYIVEWQSSGGFSPLCTTKFGNVSFFQSFKHKIPTPNNSIRKRKESREKKRKGEINTQWPTCLNAQNTL